MAFTTKVRPAFTLIELLLSVVVVLLLASIAFPVFTSVSAAAKAVRCTGNLRSLGVAIMLRAESEERMFPYGVDSNGRFWNQQIRDYMGGAGSGDSVFFCPGANMPATQSLLTNRSNYISNRRVMADGQKRPNGTYPERIGLDNVLRPQEIALLFDGTTNAQGVSDYGIWRQTGFDKGSRNEADKPLPDNETDGSGRNASISWRHEGKTNVVFVDGHVASVPIGELLYKNLQIAY